MTSDAYLASSAPALAVRVGARTDVGRVRRENQDRISRFNCPLGEVFLVVDGMGGHRGGALAAEMVVTGLERQLQRAYPAASPAVALQDAAQRTHQAIQAKSADEEADGDGMGATAVLALIRDGQALVAHVGDSRAYLFRDASLLRLTRDHTLVQKLVDDRLLTEEQAREHPDASVVSRAFGRSADLEIEIAPVLDLLPGDRLVLCSDGLSGYVDDTAIRNVLANAGPDAADRLVDLALGTGSTDNVSVQVLTFGEPATAPRPGVLQAAEVPRRETARRWGRRDWLLVGIGALTTLLLFLVGSLIFGSADGGDDHRRAEDTKREEEKASAQRLDTSAVPRLDRDLGSFDRPDSGDEIALAPPELGVSPRSTIWLLLAPGKNWTRLVPHPPEDLSPRWEIYFTRGAEAWVEPVAEVLNNGWQPNGSAAAKSATLLIVIPDGSSSGRGQWRGVRLFAPAGVDTTVAELENEFGLKPEPMGRIDEVPLSDRVLLVLVPEERFAKEGG